MRRVVEETLVASRRPLSSAMGVVRAATSSGNVTSASSREAEVKNRATTRVLLCLRAIPRMAVNQENTILASQSRQGRLVRNTWKSVACHPESGKDSFGSGYAGGASFPLGSSPFTNPGSALDLSRAPSVQGACSISSLNMCLPPVVYSPLALIRKSHTMSGVHHSTVFGRDRRNGEGCDQFNV